MSEEPSVFAPFFILLIFGLTTFVVIGFHRGKKKNRRIYLSAFSDLIDIFKPNGQTFTNIGGQVGHHAVFTFDGKKPISEIEATITLLPRQAPLYLPISKLLMRSDRLFITFYTRFSPPGEGHLVEKAYDGFRGHEITNAAGLSREEVKWGENTFCLYYDRITMYDRLKQLLADHPDAGAVKQIAVIADQKKGFVFMIPCADAVKRDLEPVFHWMCQMIE